MSPAARIGVVILAMTFCFPVVAAAGTYEVLSCANAGGVNRAWVPFNSDTAGLVTSVSCTSVSGGPASGLSARDHLPAPPNAVAGSEAGWKITAPAGTTISRLTVQYYLGQFSAGEWLPFIRSAEGVLDSCVPPGGQTRCEHGSATYDPLGPSTSFPLNTSAVDAGVRCAAPSGTCGNGVNLNAAWLALYSTRAVVSDPVFPSLAPPVGSLWADGYRTGSQSVTVGATDNTGIRATWVAVDGVVQRTFPRTCDYLQMSPCTNEPGATMAIDTRAIADGTHQATVGADDAASNSTTASRTIVIDNTPPVAPPGLTLEGNPRRSSNSFNLHWQTPAGQVSPTAAAHWSLCPPSGGAQACVTGLATGASIERLDGLALPSSGNWDLHVWLEDAAGNSSPSQAAGPLRLSLVGSDPKVRIRSIHRTGRLVRVSGLADAPSGRVNVRVERRVGKRVLRVQGPVRIRDGRWSRRVRLTSRMARLTRLNVVVQFEAQHGYRAATARRAVPR